MSNKVATLIGFAVKAGKLIYGIDELTSSSRKRYLIVYCYTLSERSKKQLAEIAIRDRVPLIESKTQVLEDIVYKKNCKAIGVSNKQMADAMISYLTEDYLYINREEI